MKDNEKRKASKHKYSISPKGKKTLRRACWKGRGIICDYDAIYDILIHTSECDFCDKPFIDTKSRHLHHCHDCGAVLGILCRSPCNTQNLMPCPLCDYIDAIP